LSPAAAPLAALWSEQGLLRVVHPLTAVPVGDTYRVAAPRERAARSTKSVPDETRKSFIGGER
jgi:hypothetical protein